MGLAKETSTLRDVVEEARSASGSDARAAAFFCLEKLKPQMQLVRVLHDKIETSWRQGCIPSRIISKCCFRTTLDVREAGSLRVQVVFLLSRIRVFFAGVPAHHARFVSSCLTTFPTSSGTNDMPFCLSLPVVVCRSTRGRPLWLFFRSDRFAREFLRTTPVWRFPV